MHGKALFNPKLKRDDMEQQIQIRILSLLKDYSKTKAEIEQEIEAKDKEIGNALQKLKRGVRQNSPQGRDGILQRKERKDWTEKKRLGKKRSLC